MSRFSFGDDTVNHGLNLELEKQHQLPEQEGFLGANSLTCLVNIPAEEREKYLPVGEIQRGAEDTMDCASRWLVNVLEAKFTYAVEKKIFSPQNIEWLNSNGYIDADGRVVLSDAFVGINSGTTRQGNSMIAPLDAARRQGMIPKRKLPLEPWMSWEEYHDPKRITPEMYALGLEFSRRFKINHERRKIEEFEEVLEVDFLGVAGHAWPKPKNGIYPSTNAPINHAFASFRNPKYQIFDNYPDSFDGDFIKNLASDYKLLDYGYRIIISSETHEPVRTNWLQDFMSELAKFFRDILWR
jgi:hypothetical protein